jgi:predicted anti-sigma-YlaC factor YlaD
MESLTMHDLNAAYALDALDAEESREYEEHLATCERCREQLAQLGGAAGALAFAVESPAPPAELRTRILEGARAERPNVVPLRARWTVATRAIAAVAAVAAIGFGIWAVSLSRSLDRERSALEQAKRGIAVASDPSATRTRLQGTAQGTLFVSRTGDAALVVSPLKRAPTGRTYEAWVIQDGKPLPAGTFSGGGNTVVGLERRVPSGALVAVTLERTPGAETPHGKILLRSQNV